MEDHEFKEMSVTELPDRAKLFGISWYHPPIKDVCAPGNAFACRWKTFGPQLRQMLKDGGKILIHY
jgi:protein-tyrosine phosphatase